MRKPSAESRTNRVRITELQNQIAGLLAAGPRTVFDLVELTGYSVTAVRTRLGALEDTKCAHRVTVNLPDAGIEYHWHIGTAPASAAAKPRKPSAARVVVATDAELAERGPAVHQVTRRTFPLNDRRDPLVSALFGAAGSQP